MAQYIDKDALVAEIERLMNRYDSEYDEDSTEVKAAKGNVCHEILCTIDTLEVKEVDVEANIEDYINSHFTEGCDGGMISDWYKVLGGVFYNDLKEIAEHFFELGMVASNKAQKGEL